MIVNQIWAGGLSIRQCGITLSMFGPCCSTD